MDFIKYSDIVRNRGTFIEYFDKRTYRLKGSLRYWIDYTHQNEYIDIPDGYLFDFNSSPCWSHCIVDRDEFVIALIHDFLYSRSGEVIIINENNLSKKFEGLKKYSVGMKYQTIDENKKVFLYNRKFADIIWMKGANEESLEIERVDRHRKIFLGYIALRIGGASHFKK